jgi:formylglycine-generating enzyme required for sulfatase activity
VPDDLELTTRPTTPIDLPGSAPDPGMVWVGGGTFSMGPTIITRKRRRSIE